MHEAKRKKLEASGWRLGDAAEFAGLTRQEAQYVELKLKLAAGLREKRRRRRLGQADLARIVRSSQSRVAKMEAADRSVSLDLIIRSLLAMGASNPEIARLIAAAKGVSH